MAKYAIKGLNSTVSLAAAFADSGRVRILHALQDGELCACQVVELLGLAPSTVSRHLALLKQANLLEARRDGRWIHFRLSEDARQGHAAGALAWCLAHAKDDPLIRADRRRLKGIRSMDIGSICGTSG